MQMKGCEVILNIVRNERGSAVYNVLGVAIIVVVIIATNLSSLGTGFQRKTGR